LIDTYGIDADAPLPRVLSAIGERHRNIEQDGWRLMTPRHAPHATLEGHLTFVSPVKNKALVQRNIALTSL
jgi:hypothetical protein